MDDEELDAVMDATRKIPREKRIAFLLGLANALEHSNDIGDGVVQRTIEAVRREVVSPPAVVTILLR